MPTGTGDSGVAALDGKIYVVGGSSFYPHIVPTSPDMGSGTWGSSVNYEYDPAADKWRQLAPMPIGLSHVGVRGLNHKLYAFGGFTSSVTPTLKTPLLYTIRRRIRGSGFHRLVRGVDRLAPPRSTEKFTSLADALITQRRLIFTKYMTRRPISGPKKRLCRLHVIIWVSQSLTAKSTSWGDAPEAKQTTSVSTTFMIRRRIDGQRQHQCRRPEAAVRRFITMGC